MALSKWITVSGEENVHYQQLSLDQTCWKICIVAADNVFTLLGKSVTNMCVLNDIALKFKRGLAPYPSGQCRIQCSAHTSR